MDVGLSSSGNKSRGSSYSSAGNKVEKKTVRPMIEWKRTDVLKNDMHLHFPQADTLKYLWVKRIVNGSSNAPYFSMKRPADIEIWKRGKRVSYVQMNPIHSTFMKLIASNPL